LQHRTLYAFPGDIAVVFMPLLTKMFYVYHKIRQLHQISPSILPQQNQTEFEIRSSTVSQISIESPYVTLY